MKVFACLIITPKSPQIGLRTALASMGDDYFEFDWHQYYRDNRIRAFRRDFAEAVSKFKPDFTFLQIQTPNIMTEHEFEAIPGFKMAWCGDVRRPTPRHYAQEGKYLDLTCFSNQADVEAARLKGIQSEYLQCGYSPSVFYPRDVAKEQPDVVFLGNNYEGMFPQSAERHEMVLRLKGKYGERFKCYGMNWDSETKWLTEDEEADRYSRCKIAINQNHFNDVDRFTSDRLIRAMACGAFVVSNHYPNIEQDFTPDTHLVTFRSLGELTEKVDYYLDHDAERLLIAKAGLRHVSKKHSWAARVPTMLGFMERYGSR